MVRYVLHKWLGLVIAEVGVSIGFILFGAIIGASAAILYNFKCPAWYVAGADVRIARLFVADPLNANLSLRSVETPNRVIARFSALGSYTSDIFDACGVADAKVPQRVVANMVSIAAVPKVPNVVNLKVRSRSPNLATACVNALIKKLAMYQQAIVHSFLEQNRLEIKKLSEWMASGVEHVARLKAANNNKLKLAYIVEFNELTKIRLQLLLLHTVDAQSGISSSNFVDPVYVRTESQNGAGDILVGTAFGASLGLVAFLLWGIKRSSPADPP